MHKHTSIQSIIVTLACALLGLPHLGCSPTEATSPGVRHTTSVKLSAEAQTAVERQLDLFREALDQDSIHHAIRQANEVNEHLTQKEILTLDNAWRSNPTITSAKRELLTNECAKVLLNFQRAHTLYIEVFVTDVHGLNVCITNMTSDYYQADEDWWQTTYAAGHGKQHVSALEYDESAKMDSISLYVPIHDDNNSVIGIAKAVLNVNQLKQEL